MDFLDDPIHRMPTSHTNALELLTQLWSSDASPKSDDKDIDVEAYSTYHKKQCSYALHDGGRHISARTHRDILEIAKDLGQDVKLEKTFNGRNLSRISGIN